MTTAKYNKNPKFYANKVNVYIIPESVFSTFLSNKPSKLAFIEKVKEYAEDGLDGTQRLRLKEDSTVEFNVEMEEEVKVQESMDINLTEHLLETAKIKNVTFKAEAYIDNPYLLEQCFAGVTVTEGTDGNLIVDAYDNSTNDLEDKRSIVIVQSIKTKNVYVLYACVPKNGYSGTIENKNTKSESIELTLAEGVNNLKVYGSSMDYTADNYVAYPTLSN